VSLSFSLRSLICSLAWARNQPPSPTLERPDPTCSSSHFRDHGSSYAASYTNSDSPEHPERRWWGFVRPRHRASESAHFRTDSLPTDGGVDDVPNSGAGTSRKSNEGERDGGRGEGGGAGKRPMSERLRSSVICPAELWRHRQHRHETASSPVTPLTPRPHLTISSTEDEGAEGQAVALEDVGPSEEGLSSSSDAAAPMISPLAEDVEDTNPANSSPTSPSKPKRAKLHLKMPQTPSPKDVFTTHFTNTPGWQTPWKPHARQWSRSLSGKGATSGTWARPSANALTDLGKNKLEGPPSRPPSQHPDSENAHLPCCVGGAIRLRDWVIFSAWFWLVCARFRMWSFLYL
jgi:hypothetical protein